MGLIGQILTLPLAPVRGTAWVIGRVIEAAEDEYYDPEPVERELAALERELVAGRIGQRDFDRREDELLDRLDEIRAYRQSRGR
ncbi:gas vesicle protein GvpG [Kitasatospora sp. NPDC006697]|uniref:gas vesicle protein GvpG n=1 Tax=Kitasatospora sp. NPDC006697 TaxID=3364020 RepID=UPI00369A3693